MLGALYDTLSKYGDVTYGINPTNGDLAKAITYYTYSAKNGIAQAANNLGIIYLADQNIAFDERYKAIIPRKVNIKKAIYWLTKAAHGGNQAAQGTLSDLYKQDIGQPVDLIEAYAYGVVSNAEISMNNSDELSSKILENSRKNLQKIYNSLTPKQKDKASELSKLYWKKFSNINEINKKANQLYGMITYIDSLWARTMFEIYNCFNVKR